MKLSTKIKIERVRKELTLKDLSKLADVNIATLSLIENDKIKPNAMTLHKIAKALKIKLEDLL